MNKFECRKTVKIKAPKHLNVQTLHKGMTGLMDEVATPIFNQIGAPLFFYRITTLKGGFVCMLREDKVRAITGIKIESVFSRKEISRILRDDCV